MNTNANPRDDDDGSFSVESVLGQAASIAFSQRVVAEAGLFESDPVQTEIARLRSGEASWKVVAERVAEEEKRLTRARNEVERAGGFDNRRIRRRILLLVRNECRLAAFSCFMPFFGEPGDADERTCGRYKSWEEFLADVAAAIVESRGLLGRESS